MRAHIQELLQIYWSGDQLRVEQASELGGATQIFLNHPVDLALIDYVLEGTTGLDLARFLKGLSKVQKQAGHCVMLLMTHGGALPASEQAQASALGIPVVSKPQAGFEKQFLEHIANALN